MYLCCPGSFLCSDNQHFLSLLRAWHFNSLWAEIVYCLESELEIYLSLGRNSDDAYFLSAINNASTLPPLTLVIAQMLHSWSTSCSLFYFDASCHLGGQAGLPNGLHKAPRPLVRGIVKEKWKYLTIPSIIEVPICSCLGLCLLSYSWCTFFSYTLLPFRPGFPKSPITDFNMLIYK